MVKKENYRMNTKLIVYDDPAEERARGITRSLPWISAVIFAVLWAITYLVLGRMHNMWHMFNSSFPFYVTWLLGVNKINLTPGAGTFFAFVDGGLIGFVFAWLAVRLFAGKNK